MNNEKKVGLLFIGTISAILIFSYFLGVVNPFSSSKTINLMYNFAGGIELGSPVRVMGIKVGKVRSINFDPDMKDKDGNEVKLKISISISEDAWKTVKEDSKFHINLAGVIGERYIEVTPGSAGAKAVELNGNYRGQDPPRVDQLISQSYALAGRILKFVEENEGDVTHMIGTLDSLVTNLNKTLILVEKMSKDANVVRFLQNLDQITGDIASISGKLRSEDAKKTIKLLHRLLWRLDDLDGPAIRKFLQEEGIKAKLF